MPRYSARLRSDEPTLSVSLLTNDVDLARAVEDAGADAIKLHTNLAHAATGLTVGGLDREEDRLRAILDAVKVPVGIVPRGRPGTSREEVERLRDMGFDFVDLYGKHTSPAALAVEGVDHWVAPTPDYTLDMLRALARRPDVDVIETAFFPVDVYGSPLCVDDLVRLELGMEAIAPSGTPVVIPSDRKLEPHDVQPLRDVGIRNFLIGYAVTGGEVGSIVAATRAVRGRWIGGRGKLNGCRRASTRATGRLRFSASP
jgi:hypothetical protein